jgi:hypothetical protein
MDTSTILATAFSTGLATAILNQAIGWWRDSRKDHVATAREARYLAIRLAVLLEKFSLDCADSIADYELHTDFDGYAGKSRGTIPDLPEYPEGDWRVLSAELLGRCLSLRNELRLSDGHIGFWEDVGYRECIPAECAQQTGKCGYRAWILAKDLRAEYQLGPFDTKDVSQWDFVATLREKYDDAIREIRQKQSKPSTRNTTQS